MPLVGGASAKVVTGRRSGSAQAARARSRASDSIVAARSRCRQATCRVSVLGDRVGETRVSGGRARGRGRAPRNTLCLGCAGAFWRATRGGVPLRRAAEDTV